jgi:hypothetical protein
MFPEETRAKENFLNPNEEDVKNGTIMGKLSS